MTEGTGKTVDGECSTLSPSFSSTKTAPRNHRQTARATPTVPSGSYEKFNSKTRPVSKSLCPPFCKINVIQMTFLGKHNMLLSTLDPRQYVLWEPRSNS